MNLKLLPLFLIFVGISLHSLHPSLSSFCYADKVDIDMAIDYESSSGVISNYIAGVTDGPVYYQKSYEFLRKGNFKLVEVFIWLSRNELKPSQTDRRPSSQRLELERNIHIAKKQIRAIFETGAEPLIFMVSSRKPADRVEYREQVKSIINELRMSAKETGNDLSLFRFGNEPELSSFWKGTRNEFFDTYQDWARAVKEVNSHYIVEAPGFMSATARTPRENYYETVNSFTTEFLEYCKKNSVPLDVFSFHFYGPNISDLLKEIAAVKKALGKYPKLSPIFGTPKIGIDEWNIWIFVPNTYNKIFDSVHTAAHNIGALIGMLKSGAWLSVRFGGMGDKALSAIPEQRRHITGDFLLIKDDEGPKPVYYGYSAFNELMLTPNLLTTKDKQGIISAAGKSSDGRQLNILFSFYDEEFTGIALKKSLGEPVGSYQDKTWNSKVRIKIKNLPWQTIAKKVEITKLVVDAKNNLDVTGTKEVIFKKEGAGDILFDVSAETPSVVLLKVMLY